jgi:pilus assembly protein Flp/PilA
MSRFTRFGRGICRRSRRLTDDDGVTAIEYGLIAALMAVVIVAAITFLGDELVEIFNTILDALTGA